MKAITQVFTLFKTTFHEFRDDNATQMAAALSYYALFAIPPILLIVLSILNVFLAGPQAKETILAQAQQVLGSQVAETLHLIISHLDAYADQSTFAQWIGIITLIVAATTAINHLQISLNRIWEISPTPGRPWLFTIRQRLVSLAFVSSIGFLLLISFVANALFTILGSYVAELIHLPLTGLLVTNFLFSFIGVTLLIALIFKYLPSGDMHWTDVFVGAVVTSVFIAIGRYLIEIYIGQGSFGSAYGAAGSVLILILWTYYSSLIFFFGAEFTQVYAHMYGSGVKLDKGTIPFKEHIVQQTKLTNQRQQK